MWVWLATRAPPWVLQVGTGMDVFMRVNLGTFDALACVSTYCRTKNATSLRGRCQNCFDFCVKISRHLERVAIRIRTGVRNILHHFLHEQRISRNNAQNSWRRGSTLFPENLTQVEPCELHNA